MQIKTKKRFFQPLFFLILLIASLWVSYQGNPYRDMVLLADAEGYYMYLPAVFIYDGFEKVPVRTTSQFTKAAGTNKIFTKFTCGVAMLQLPFFLGAKLKEPDTGYSRTFGAAIMIAGVFYGITGLWLLSLSLRRYFSTKTSNLAILSIYLGTNLFYYTILGPGMSHVYSFFLFALFIYFTQLFYEKSTIYKILFLGFILGWIVLIRPTNLMLVLYFIFYDVYNIAQFKARITFFRVHLRKLMLMPFCAALMFLPQMYYWYYMFGKFFIYSYNNEGFIHWKNPYFLSVLFSHTDGWLLYSPFAILLLIGAIFAAFQKRQNGGLILVIIIVMTYIFGSWWAWWFGASFGHRCYVEYYALLVFPFAFFLQKNILQNSFINKILFCATCILFIYYNLALTYQANHFARAWDGPNWGWDDYFQLLNHIF